MEKIAVHITNEEESMAAQKEFAKRGIPWSKDREVAYGLFGGNDFYLAESVMCPGTTGKDQSRWWLQHGYTLIEAAEFLGTKLNPEDVKAGTILGHRCEGCRYHKEEPKERCGCETKFVGDHGVVKTGMLFNGIAIVYWKDIPEDGMPWCPLSQCFIVKEEDKPKEPEIKPCYCGKIPSMSKTSNGFWVVQCECGRSSAYRDKKECIESWNKFVAIPTPKKGTPDIKPCYCGARPEYENYARVHKFSCKKCHCSAQDDTIEKAVEIWNRSWALRSPQTIEHCAHCGAERGVEEHTEKCPLFTYELVEDPELVMRLERRKFYEDLASKGRDIPKRILGSGAKRLKSSEEVEGE